jgi:hypothetical protein
MKTKKEIRELLYDLEHPVFVFASVTHEEHRQGEIKALKWVLEEDKK